MASFIVVVLEPYRKCLLAVIAAGIRMPVGPFGLQGPVEAFHLPVLPRAVRLDELLTDTVRGADGSAVGLVESKIASLEGGAGRMAIMPVKFTDEFKRDIIRGLKRYVIRELYHLVKVGPRTGKS